MEIEINNKEISKDVEEKEIELFDAVFNDNG